MKETWKKKPGQVSGAVATYRKGRGSVAIHDYGDGRFHVTYLGVSEIFTSLNEAKEYGNDFVWHLGK